MTVAADPKPQKRYRATRKEWEDMHRAFLGSSCRVCGGRWDSLHHIVRRSQGGDDVIVNMLPTCGSGTWGCHGKIEARDPDALAAVRAALNPANLAYVRYRKSDAWLDRAYPKKGVRNGT